MNGPILEVSYMHFRGHIYTLGYKIGDLAYTSGVYAFKAICDLPSVAAIIGYDRAIKLFQETEVENDYFDDLYGG